MKSKLGSLRMKSKRRKCLLMVAMVVSLVFLVVSIYLIYLYINPALFRHTGIYKYNSSLRPILIAVNENSDLILCYTFSIASVKPPKRLFLPCSSTSSYERCSSFYPCTHIGRLPLHSNIKTE